MRRPRDIVGWRAAPLGGALVVALLLGCTSPEPEQGTLLAAGVLALAFCARRRARVRVRPI